MADLLFLSHRMPRPAEESSAARSWQILRRLAERHRVHLGCFDDGTADASHIAELERHCASLASWPLRPFVRRLKSLAALQGGEAMSVVGFRDVRLMRWIAETFARHQPSAAFVSGPAMAQYLVDYRFATRAIDLVEVASEKCHHRADRSSWPLSGLYRREAHKLLACESQVARSFDYTFFASTAEATLFLKRTRRPSARVLTMRNGVDFDAFDPGQDSANPYPGNRKVVLFPCGTDDWSTIAAARWFVTEVMIALRHRFPALDLWIVGPNPPRALRALGRGDVHVASDGGDIRPYFAHADAVVVPVPLAHGAQQKVLEGMAMKKPVIAMPAALEGLDLRPDEEVLAAASGPHFARAIAMVLGGGMPALGARARARIVADYGWRATLRPLDEVLADARPAIKPALATAS